MRSRQFETYRFSAASASNRSTPSVITPGSISGQSEVNVLFSLLQFGGDSEFADGVAYGVDGGTGLPFGPDPVSAVKAAAAYKAVKESGADLIVAPRYELSVQNYVVFKKVTAKVTGNKGTIKSIR